MYPLPTCNKSTLFVSKIIFSMTTDTKLKERFPASNVLKTFLQRPLIALRFTRTVLHFAFRRSSILTLQPLMDRVVAWAQTPNRAIWARHVWKLLSLIPRRPSLCGNRYFSSRFLTTRFGLESVSFLERHRHSIHQFNSNCNLHALECYK